MAATYTIPTKVRLEFDRDATPNPFPSPGFTTQAQGSWQRSFRFWDTGHSGGLAIAWGAMKGNLTIVDLMLASAYAHTAGGDSAAPSGNSGQLWLPNDLTPISGGALVTTEINLFFDTTGASGTAFATFECIAQPEHIRPEMLLEGIAGASIIWRWEILDDTPPTITT